MTSTPHTPPSPGAPADGAGLQCSLCRGSGYWRGASCPNCKGSGLEPSPRSLASAPRNGKVVCLLVDYEGQDPWTPLEDAKQAWTIGSNEFDKTGEDRWRFAGWDWSHDYWCEGNGTVIGWAPFSPLVVTSAALAQPSPPPESGLREALEAARAALLSHAVHMEMDWPSETPTDCGWWCNLCDDHIDGDRETGPSAEGHKSTCAIAKLTAALSAPAQTAPVGGAFEQLPAEVFEHLHPLTARFAARVDAEIAANRHKGDFQAWRPTPEELKAEVDDHLSKLWAYLSMGLPRAAEYAADVGAFMVKAFDLTGQQGDHMSAPFTPHEFEHNTKAGIEVCEHCGQPKCDATRWGRDKHCAVRKAKEGFAADVKRITSPGPQISKGGVVTPRVAEGLHGPPPPAEGD